MKVYIAGRFDDRPKIAEIKREFEAAEIEVTADWIDDPGDNALGGDCLDEKRRRINLDLRQVAECDILILFKPTESHGNTTGGHHVETGAALILGKPVFLIGSNENLFHYHENVREFDSPQAAIQAVLAFNPEEFRPSPYAVDSYQRWTRTTALYPGKGEGKMLALAYLAVGVGGEAGEIARKVLSHLEAESNRLLMAGGFESQEQIDAHTNLGEVIRKLHHFCVIAEELEALKRPMREGKMSLPDLAPFPEEMVEPLVKELGDEPWYLVRMADELGVLFSRVLAVNEAKLMSRKERQALHGSGDNR